MAAARIIGLCVFSAVMALAQPTSAGNAFVLRGGIVHTISGPVIENGVVLVRDGRIVAVGKGLPTPEGYEAIDIAGQHVYPGMIDSASLLKPADIGPSNEQLRASRANGVTSVIALPDGDLLAGQISVIHLDGIAVASPPMVHLRFPAIETLPRFRHEPEEDDDGDRTAGPEPEPVSYAKAKRLYDARMKALTAFFEQARRYHRVRLAKTGRLKPDRKYEPMLPVLEGATPLVVTAVRAPEIRKAIEFADQQKIRIILADAYEAYKLAASIKERNIPVILGPTLSLPLNRDDPYDRSFRTPAELFEAGIQFSIATFSAKGTRNLSYQAAAAVPFGLPADEAYKAVSLNAAQIFGVGKRLGSIDEGKTANLIVTDGDPLRVGTHVKLMFIDGKPVSLETQAKVTFEKHSGQ